MNFAHKYPIRSFFILAFLLGAGTIFLVIQGIIPVELALSSVLSASIAGISSETRARKAAWESRSKIDAKSGIDLARWNRILALCAPIPGSGYSFGYIIQSTFQRQPNPIQQHETDIEYPAAIHRFLHCFGPGTGIGLDWLSHAPTPGPLWGIHVVHHSRHSDWHMAFATRDIFRVSSLCLPGFPLRRLDCAKGFSDRLFSHDAAYSFVVHLLHLDV